MTDPTHDLDELASAHLDGQTSPEEAARVEGDPVLLARVGELQAVRTAVAIADGPIDEDRRDAAILAALAVASDEAHADDVALLAAARARRQRRVWQIRLVGAAAAIAVALTAVLPNLVGNDDGGTEILASPNDADSERQGPATTLFGGGTAGDRGASAPAADDAPLAMEMSVPLLTTANASDLGAADDLPALAVRARSSLDGSAQLAAATPPADPEPADACLATLQAQASNLVLLVALATLDGRPVVAVVVAEPDGGRHLVVAAVEGCEPLGSVPV